MKVSELAIKLNKTRKTIWNYMDKGILRYHQDVKRGGRYFVWNEVLEDLGILPAVLDIVGFVAFVQINGASKKGA